mgnify:CR=1 FL=1|tara:strand:- start:720 stop:899 length:180 start_codon:yes stop_codon:yes gene_type:complete
MAALVTTIAMAIVGGILTGLVMKVMDLFQVNDSSLTHFSLFLMFEREIKITLDLFLIMS